MNTGQLLGDIIGSAVGYSLAASFMAFRRRSWARRAHKLAANSDIALPGPLTARVARFLRDEWLFGLLVAWVFVAPLTGMLAAGGGRHSLAQWFPWIMSGLPVLCVCLSYASTLWPRWRASGASRATHLGHVTVGQAFTPAEVAVALTGAVFAAVCSGWGLRLAAAPASWWVICAAAFGAGAVAWWHAARAIMSRPSEASDDIELGWDDLFRFRHVRGLTIGASWLPAIFIFTADSQLALESNRQTLVLWPVCAMGAAAVLAIRVFRQGRQLWRRAWVPPAESAGSAPQPW